MLPEAPTSKHSESIIAWECDTHSHNGCKWLTSSCLSTCCHGSWVLSSKALCLFAWAKHFLVFDGFLSSLSSHFFFGRGGGGGMYWRQWRGRGECHWEMSQQAVGHLLLSLPSVFSRFFLSPFISPGFSSTPKLAIIILPSFSVSHHLPPSKILSP